MLSGFITGYAFWLLLGLALLVFELFAPGLIAVFFGIGALAVGVLTLLGVLDSLAAQLVWFALISLLALVGLRRHFRRWLRGGVTGRSRQDLDDTGVLGARVEVLVDFSDGQGEVLLNGAKWDAESVDPLRAGDSAWVIKNRGIVLEVSSRQLARRG